MNTSTKWSELPSDITAMIQKLMQEQYAGRLAPGQFIAEGRIYPAEITLRIGYLEEGAIRQINFEGSIEYVAGSEKVVDCIQHLFEATGSMMESYVTDPSTEFPVQWQKYDVEKLEIYLKHSTVNSSLEAEADRLLGESSDGLIQQTEGEEIEDLKKKMGLSDDKTTIH